jgi:guanylate kinase
LRRGHWLQNHIRTYGLKFKTIYLIHKIKQKTEVRKQKTDKKDDDESGLDPVICHLSSEPERKERYMSRFVILSGPSCVGKGPLYKALRRFYPDLANRLQQIVLYNSRDPRPGEQEGVDYYFRPRAEIEALAQKPGFTSADVRGDLQAIEIAGIEAILEQNKDAFFEGNPFIPAKLSELRELEKISTLKIFLAPLCREEIEFFKDPQQRTDLEKLLPDIMRRKLLRRVKRQKINPSLKDLENIEQRVASAIIELREAWKFDYVIPTHDGEDSENWDAFYYPIGDSRIALLTFAALLQGESPAYAEHWEKDLVPKRL